MNFQENKEQKRICPGCGKRLPWGIEVHTGDLINDEAKMKKEKYIPHYSKTGDLINDEPAPEPKRSNKPKMTQELRISWDEILQKIKEIYHLNEVVLMKENGYNKDTIIAEEPDYIIGEV